MGKIKGRNLISNNKIRRRHRKYIKNNNEPENLKDHI